MKLFQLKSESGGFNSATSIFDLRHRRSERECVIYKLPYDVLRMVLLDACSDTQWQPYPILKINQSSRPQDRTSGHSRCWERLGWISLCQVSRRFRATCHSISQLWTSVGCFPEATELFICLSKRRELDVRAWEASDRSDTADLWTALSSPQASQRTVRLQILEIPYDRSPVISGNIARCDFSRLTEIVMTGAALGVARDRTSAWIPAQVPSLHFPLVRKASFFDALFAVHSPALTYLVIEMAEAPTDEDAMAWPVTGKGIVEALRPCVETVTRLKLVLCEWEDAVYGDPTPPLCFPSLDRLSIFMKSWNSPGDNLLGPLDGARLPRAKVNIALAIEGSLHAPSYSAMFSTLQKARKWTPYALSIRFRVQTAREPDSVEFRLYEAHEVVLQPRGSHSGPESARSTTLILKSPTATVNIFYTSTNARTVVTEFCADDFVAGPVRVLAVNGCSWQKVRNLRYMLEHSEYQHYSSSDDSSEEEEESDEETRTESLVIYEDTESDDDTVWN